MGGVNGGRIAARIATDTMQQYFARHMKALQPGMEKTFIMRGFDITNRAVYENPPPTRRCRAWAPRASVPTPAAAWPIWYTPGIPARICSMQVRCGRSPVTTRWYSSWWTAARSPVSRPPYTRKNLITRALGVSANIVPEYNRCEIEEGDILLLCTDGLTNMVSDDDIAQVLREVPFFDATSILVDRALQAGGQDNITVLLMGVETTEVNNG